MCLVGTTPSHLLALPTRTTLFRTAVNKGLKYMAWHFGVINDAAPLPSGMKDGNGSNTRLLINSFTV